MALTSSDPEYYRLFNSLERRIEVIERDLKDFFKTTADHDQHISTLEKPRLSS